MTDSIERLYQAVIAAKDLDPAVSRTARLFKHGRAKMAKKLAELTRTPGELIDAARAMRDAPIHKRVFAALDLLEKARAGDTIPAPVQS